MATTALRTLRKPYGRVQMEGPVAAWYTRVTRGRRDHWTTAEAIARALPGGGDVLEVAPGPGYGAIELAKLGPYRVTALDISRSFVRIASENARRAGVAIDFRHGDVAAMPFAAESFDFVTCSAAFKNFPDPVAALDEIHRVLRPGGRASIRDMRKDAPPDAIAEEIHGMRLAWPTALLMRFIFRFALLREAYTRERLDAVVARSRFGHGEIVPDGVGFELKLSK